MEKEIEKETKEGDIDMSGGMEDQQQPPPRR